MESEKGQAKDDAVDGATEVADVKRRFREALERKQAKRPPGAVVEDGEDRRKAPEAHGPAHTQRQFRRKSGG